MHSKGLSIKTIIFLFLDVLCPKEGIKSMENKSIYILNTSLIRSYRRQHKILQMGVDIKDLYLIDPKVVILVPGDSEDLVLVLLSFRKRLREIINEVELTDLEMMRILISECEILINNRYTQLLEAEKPLLNK